MEIAYLVLVGVSGVLGWLVRQRSPASPTPTVPAQPVVPVVVPTPTVPVVPVVPGVPATPTAPALGGHLADALAVLQHLLDQERQRWLQSVGARLLPPTPTAPETPAAGQGGAARPQA